MKGVYTPKLHNILSNKAQNGENYNKKSHTFEGGAHPRISVWHSLMNLKNNYLLKKLLKWANKNLIILMSKKKINKN